MLEVASLPPAECECALTAFDRVHVFRIVAAHLRRQGCASTMPWFSGPRCVYWAADGRKCAIGILISAEAFDPVLNTTPLIDPSVIEMLELSGFSLNVANDDLDFLLAIQAAHDEVPFDGDCWFSEVELRLAEVAQRFGLAVEDSDLECGGQASVDHVQQVRRSYLHRVSDRDEFQHVEAPLKLLNLVDERGRFTQPAGEFALRDSTIRPCRL